MENKNQTAVMWFAEQLGITKGSMIEKALAMEKEQVKEGYNQGYREGEYDAVEGNCVNMDISKFSNAEIYYTETYGK